MLDSTATAAAHGERSSRDRALAAPQASEKQFHSLADLIPQLVWMAEADGAVFWFNRRWDDFAGAHADGAIRDWKALLPPTLRPTVELRWAECRARAEPMEMELALRGKDGGYHPFLTRVVPVQGAEGRIHRWIGTHIDISEQHRREEHVRLVVSELSHRMKNLLAVITAVATQTARHNDDAAGYPARFALRLQALSHGHDLLVRGNWQGALLADVVAAQMKPFLGSRDDHIEASGPPLVLTDNAVQYLGLALHELATNSCKHGALSVPHGRVAIRWQHDPATDQIRIDWNEREGPAVAPPRRHGFGCILVERIVPQALGGIGALTFAHDGVTWALQFPAERNVNRERSAA